MSATFYGVRPDGATISFDYDERGWLNLNIGNVAALMGLLELVEPDQDPTYGQATMADACRAVQRARASFDYEVDAHTRAASDVKKPGRCRVITCGLDEYALRDRLERFAEFLCEATERGAVGIHWS